MPQVQFDAAMPATFTFVGLMRDLVCDSGYQMRKGDGIDFCHAVMATAFSTIATLDKQWKRRVQNLPKPNKIPHIYYEPEIGAMIDAVEAGLAQLKQLRVPERPCNKRKRPRCFRNVAFIYAGNDLLSHTLSRAVQSALRGLTSVFGMGTGGSPAVRSPTSGAVSYQPSAISKSLC